jgi:membrane associated rhomboid family serine protease
VNPGFPEIACADGRTLAVVGVYSTRTEAYDRSLVVLAMEIPHWILRHGEGFALCVDPARAEPVAAELARFEAEGIVRPVSPEVPGAKFSPFSLWMCGWILTGFYAVELAGPAWWVDRGTASSKAIMAGQWWLAFTALTLHADLGHLGANLTAGLVYAAFLLPILGAGWTWLFILLAGGAGNCLNAWGYRNVEHLSFGASTSVFAALGILVGAQCAMKVLARRAVRWREFLLPVGAGLGLLAYLGVGDQQVDYMAHFFGLIAGLPFGFAGVWLRLGSRTPPLAQALLAWTAPALLCLCWLLAARSH